MLRKEGTTGVTPPLVFSGSRRCLSSFTAFVSGSNKVPRTLLIDQKLDQINVTLQEALEFLKSMDGNITPGIKKILKHVQTVSIEQSKLLAKIKAASAVGNQLRMGAMTGTVCFTFGGVLLFVAYLVLKYFDLPGLEDTKANLTGYLLSILKDPEVREATESYAQMFAYALWMVPISWIISWLKGKAYDGIVMSASEFSDIACSFAFTVNTIIYLSNGPCDEGELMEKLGHVGLSCREFNADMLQFLTRKGYFKRDVVVQTGVIYNSSRVMVSAPVTSLQACTSGKMKNDIAAAVVRKGTLADMMSS